MFCGKRNFYELRKQTTRAAKEQEQQVHQVPLCLDMCAMQKPQTFNWTMPSREAITVLSLI
jgi:hypothetical protein